VIVRPISIRCISLVPSKMVKILAIGAVWFCPVGPPSSGAPQAAFAAIWH
jgi:hypothetical protein